MEILKDSFSKRLWSYDASLFELIPEAIALPTSEAEVVELIKNAKSVTARGGGTGTTGGALGRGLIIDLSKSMRSLITFNEETKTVTAQAGMTLDDLNKFLSRYNRMLGVDLSTHERATLGGMVASNSAGAHSTTWGSMRDHITSLKSVLSDGSIHEFGFCRTEDIDKSPITQKLFTLREKYQEILLKETPCIRRSAFHIPLDEILYPDGMHVGRLFAGSQGTLGIVTEVTLTTVPKIAAKEFALLSFSSLQDTLLTAKQLAKEQLYALELIDDLIVEASKKKQSHFPIDRCAYYLLLESSSHTFRKLLSQPLAKASYLLSQDEYDELVLLRQEGLSLLISGYRGKTPAGFIEDLVCPLEALVPFYMEVTDILQEYGCSYAVYGHAGAGCLHIRPFLHVRDNDSERPLIPLIMKRVCQIVHKYHGSLSSEHGSGIIRSWAIPLLFSRGYIEALQSVKNIFDPRSIMNPGKLFQPYEDFSHLFTSPTTSYSKNVFFSSHRNGGLEKSLDSCTNNGRCRKGDGLMCPPFQITRDERDSTKGRAHGLLHRCEHGLSSEEEVSSFNRILDFCVQCKGCIQECPSHINISKMKEEELWRKRQEGRVPLQRGIRDWIFGHLPLRLAHSSVPLVHFIAQLLKPFSSLFGLSKDAFELFLPKRCDLPSLTPTTNPTLILFIDCFSQTFTPHVVKAAIALLQVLGERPLLHKGCCGRSLFSKGYLEEGMSIVQTSVETLKNSSLPIVFLEPSCWSATQDEWQDLPHITLTDLSSRSVRFEEILFSHKEKISALRSGPFQKKLFFHEHCHTRSLTEDNIPFRTMKILVESLGGYELVMDKEASCCGMAGSFGLEQEHYELSKKIGEKTFSKLKPEEISACITSGISCRSQLLRLFPNVPVYHPAEFFLELFTCSSK